eukprot:7913273-Lingulodinium_polyedra.AAC.1
MTAMMCDNPDYENIGPLTIQLKEQIKLCRSLQSDGKGLVIDAGTIKMAMQAAEFGLETVVMTFVLFCALRVWPEQVTNLPLARKAVHECREEVKASKVVLPQQMLTLLE